MPQRNLLPGGRRHQDGFEGGNVVAKVAVVTQVHRVSLQALDRSGDVHASDRRLNHILNIADGQAVAGNGIPVDGEIQVVAAHDALGVNAECARHIAHDHLDLLAQLLERIQIRAGQLDADRRLDAGREHVDARLDRHGPRVGDARDLNRRIHGVRQLVHRHPSRPLTLRFERDGGFDHRKRGRIRRGLGAPGFSEDMLHLGECLDDLVERVGEHPLVDATTGFDGGNHIGQPRAGQDQAGRSLRYIGGAGHRNANLRLFQGRGVVYAVSCHAHGASRLL